MDNKWIEWKWTKEKPYPEELETKIDVKMRGGGEVRDWDVGYWFNHDPVDSNWYQDDNTLMDITHYRIAED